MHVPTWVDPRVSALARDQFGTDAEEPGRWDLAYNVSDEDVWALRRELRVSLVEDVRRRLRAAWKKRGAADAELAWTDSVLDPDILTIGFARRVPTYKRLTLMLREPERLKALLLHKTHPIQLVIAGKSHPADDAGKKMIQDLVRFTDDPAVRHRIAFLPNYDIAMARTLFPGCDVWLNNPLRPLEACGTSGMKAALNGSLNLSVLDGWWDEMYDGENGWAIPTANNGASPEERDDIEAAALYELLETQVAPRFYGLTVSDGAGAAGPSQSGPQAVPTHWVSMIKHTMSHLGPAVSADRMLKDYVNVLYRPAAVAGRRAVADNFAEAKALAAWTSMVRAAWPQIQVEHVDSVGVSEDPQIGDMLQVNAYVALHDLTPDDVAVEVAYGKAEDSDELADVTVAELKAIEDLGKGRHLFSGTVVIDRSGSFGYTVRVLPKHTALASKAELGLIVNAREARSSGYRAVRPFCSEADGGDGQVLSGVALGVLQDFADDAEGTVGPEGGRDLPNEGDGGLAVVGDGVSEVVQGVVERVEVHSVVLREVQRLRERLQDGPLGIGGWDQQSAPAGVGRQGLQLLDGPGVCGVDLHGFLCLPVPLCPGGHRRTTCGRC